MRRLRRLRRLGEIAWAVPRWVLAAWVLVACVAAAPARPGSSARPADKDDDGSGPLPGLATAVAGLEHRAGLLDLYVDRGRGKIWLAVPPPPARGAADAPPGLPGEVARYLYVEGLATGIGSSALELDRGASGEAQVVVLRRLGGRVLIEALNLRYRSLSADAAERRAAEESFAGSVLWAGRVVAEDPGGVALVDFTSFVVRDARGIAGYLKESGQGTWTLDGDRSAADPAGCLALPENIELEALLTYSSEDPGPIVRQVAGQPDAVTFVQHQSLRRLPDAAYRPRRFDPRMGSFPITFSDYAAPLGSDVGTRWLVRFRLEKVNPAAERSPVKKPIVFYVDRGAPEPVRSALLEGAGWWREAFEKAGFIDAFRVELLPEGVSPLDARYNVIEWVHRATRGWSYGGGVIDPRTGEMVTGHVTLGSLRIRQDILIFEGLSGAERTGSGAPDDPVVLALARIRQLAAHEVGHALGLSHNFAASTYGRASVMDYPAPLIAVASAGALDFSQAYAVGVGEWDRTAIRYAYGEFQNAAGEQAGLDAIVRDAQARGLLFLTDEDARPEGAAQPLANLWDNGPDPVAGLLQALAVRRVALDHFGAGNIAAGKPLAELQEVLVPVYFYHRYELDAALKVVGGLDYTYAVRDGEARDARPAAPVDAAWQRRALAAVLGVLEPSALDLPEPVVRLLLPRPAGYTPNLEMFGGSAAPAFDPLAAAATASDMVVRGLLNPARAARLVDFHRRDPRQLGFDEVLEALIDHAFAGAVPPNERQREVRRTTQWVVTHELLALASSAAATPAVRSRVEAHLAALRTRLTPAGHGAAAAAPKRAADAADRAQEAFLAGDITRWLERRAADPLHQVAIPPPPPGQPIGASAGRAPAGTLAGRGPVSGRSAAIPTIPWGPGEGAEPPPPPPGLAGCSWDG